MTRSASTSKAHRPRGRHITIRHLLTHTSGLDREAPGSIRLKFRVTPMCLRPPTPSAALRAGRMGILQSRLLCARRDHPQSFRSAHGWSSLNEKVFQPSGMTRPIRRTRTQRLPNRLPAMPTTISCWSPRLAGSASERRVSVHGAGPGKMGRRALYRQDSQTPSRRQMWTPVTLNDGTSASYGFGWELQSRPGSQARASQRRRCRGFAPCSPGS